MATLQCGEVGRRSSSLSGCDRVRGVVEVEVAVEVWTLCGR